MGDIYLHDKNITNDNVRPRRSEALILQILHDIGSPSPLYIAKKNNGFLLTYTWDKEVNFLLEGATAALERNQLIAYLGVFTAPQRELIIPDVPPAIYSEEDSQITSSLQYANQVNIIRIKKFAVPVDKPTRRFIIITLGSKTEKEHLLNKGKVKICHAILKIAEVRSRSRDKKQLTDKKQATEKDEGSTQKWKPTWPNNIKLTPSGATASPTPTAGVVPPQPSRKKDRDNSNKDNSNNRNINSNTNDNNFSHRPKKQVYGEPTHMASHKNNVLTLDQIFNISKYLCNGNIEAFVNIYNEMLFENGFDRIKISDNIIRVAKSLESEATSTHTSSLKCMDCHLSSQSSEIPSNDPPPPPPVALPKPDFSVPPPSISPSNIPPSLESSNPPLPIPDTQPPEDVLPNPESISPSPLISSYPILPPSESSSALPTSHSALPLLDKAQPSSQPLTPSTAPNPDSSSPTSPIETATTPLPSPPPEEPITPRSTTPTGASPTTSPMLIDFTSPTPERPQKENKTNSDLHAYILGLYDIETTFEVPIPNEHPIVNENIFQDLVSLAAESCKDDKHKPYIPNPNVGEYPPNLPPPIDLMPINPNPNTGASWPSMPSAPEFEPESIPPLYPLAPVIPTPDNPNTSPNTGMSAQIAFPQGSKTPQSDPHASHSPYPSPALPHSSIATPNNDIHPSTPRTGPNSKILWNQIRANKILFNHNSPTIYQSMDSFTDKYQYSMTAEHTHNTIQLESVCNSTYLTHVTSPQATYSQIMDTLPQAICHPTFFPYNIIPTMHLPYSTPSLPLSPLPNTHQLPATQQHTSPRPAPVHPSLTSASKALSLPPAQPIRRSLRQKRQLQS